ncbi:cupin domain-containing protein [Mycobacterium sp. NPDC048908]|uniref:cupin domain-containing protein n=1 Tax=Mycobacterium sp. NPDC048908 TaxID=3364292 RepID=UPI003722DA76
MDVRRVVTGHDASGKSVFVSDELVAASPTTGFHRLWGGDTTPQFPDDGAMPEQRTYFPPVGRFRFGMFAIPPKTVAGSEINPADVEAEAPGLLRYMDPADPGMHTTDTIDFEVVLEGTVVLELDDGAEVTLNPGDTVVQNGTRHRWRNGGDTTARIAVFMCGARHTAVPAG